MYRILLPALTIAVFMTPVAMADDDLLRLPGQGELKPDTINNSINVPARLAPGGGLLLSFDSNSDGLISLDEIDSGIIEAFGHADANADGNLSPLEQFAWAEDLPTRDDTLSNPARFDPNLDRAVSLEEFSGAVRHIAAIYADETTGSVALVSLEARSDSAGKDSDNRKPPARARRDEP